MNQSSLLDKLPDKLKNLVNEIEAKAGCKIRWEQDKDLAGKMWSNVEGVVPIVKFREFTESGVAHELLHLKLMLSGFPQFICFDDDPRIELTVQMLIGAIQHPVIFPQLRQLGYKDDESEAIQKQLIHFRRDDFDSLANDPVLKAKASMFYVRSLIDTKDLDLQTKIQGVFTDNRLQVCRTLGEKVIKIIRSRDLSKTQETFHVLEEVIAVLELSDTLTVEFP